MKSSYKKLSIITPSYNQGKFIKQTIDSVLGQDYPNLEYWIIDGGSTDETIDILKSYGNKIMWISEKDNGQAEAINKGMSKVNGEVVAFINSDDFYLDGAFNKVMSCFDGDNNIKWITGDYLIVNFENKPIQSFISRYKNLWKYFPGFTSLSLTNYICQPATFWRKGILDEIGNFDQKLYYTMDYDYWMRLIKVYKPKIIGDKLCAFRVHDGSKGGEQFVKQFDEELVVAKKYCSTSFLIFAHIVHNELIKLIYKIIK